MDHGGKVSGEWSGVRFEEFFFDLAKGCLDHFGFFGELVREVGFELGDQLRYKVRTEKLHVAHGQEQTNFLVHPIRTSRLLISWGNTYSSLRSPTHSTGPC